MKNEFVNKVEEQAALLMDLKNTPLSRRLQQFSEQKGKPVSYNVLAPKIQTLSQGEDSFGCTIATYRMLRLAQGKDDPGQEAARQFLASQEDTFRSGEEGMLSVGLGGKMGIEKADSLIDFPNRTELEINQQERNLLNEGSWVSKMVNAIDAGFLIYTAMPADYIYPWLGLDRKYRNHTFLMNGISYDNGNISFLIRDPLGLVDSIRAEDLINYFEGEKQNPEYRIKIAPTKRMLKEGKGAGYMITKGETLEVEDPPKIVIKKKVKIKKPINY